MYDPITPGPLAREKAPTQFERDVLAGLNKIPKTISPKYFYDAEGSALFERICGLDEYYLTRTELDIMTRYASHMAEIIGPKCLLIELGSGSSLKTELLLDHLQEPAGYVPVEISESALQSSTDRLRARFPDLEIVPVQADYMAHFPLPRMQNPARKNVVYFPGSTIGNMEPAMARSFLRRIQALTGPAGGVLIGVDLKKDPSVLNAAYNDADGVTAAFNLNLLVRINRELGADFNLDRFEHRAFYDEEHGRIEMQLISLERQTVNVARRAFDFEAGEPIVTEYSYKYDLDQFAGLAGDAGFCVHRAWLDDAGWFGVLYLLPY